VREKLRWTVVAVLAGWYTRRMVSLVLKEP
jgi:hypothetical protein